MTTPQSMSWAEFAERIRSLARAPGGPEGVDTGLRHRLRLVVSCLLLVTAAFSVAPGKIISDTKLDMAINPGAFLNRALHLWDANEHFGQLQNQAYGYLFPMGPFYLLGDVAGIAPWVTQRLWIAAVLCAAFVGVVKLAEALDIGSPNARLVAGFAYALAPRAQELVAVNSSELLPTAVLPWILLPLVNGSREGSPRRAAALSALAVVFCGGINAAAEAAVLVVPFLFLLTRTGGPRKWRLIAWWLPSVAFACVWWAVPLLVMGKYGFKFIDYVESAGTTTQTTSLTNIMRGASNWVGHVPVNGLPWWPAGYTLSTEPWLIALTGLVAGLGVIGLCRRGMPERNFLILSLLFGVAIIVTGHQSTIAPPFADDVRGLFDGVLAAFRNIHKFDALVRLPLALGTAYLLVAPAPRWRPALALVTLATLAGSFIPVLSAGLAARGSFKEIPSYWREATSWVNGNAGEHTVLAVPGARFGEYTWGRPIDEPMQPLLKARWSSRMIVPWGSAGLARLMEGIDERFATGRGSPGLTQVLSRMGVRFLLVRNDLDQSTTRGAWPGRVHEAIRESLGPAAKPVKEFGPPVGSPFNTDATTSLYQPYKALEIYEIPRASALVNAVATTRPLRVTGGPESLLTLADNGLLADDRPVLFNEDGDAADIPSSDTVVTDTLRKREVNFADAHKGSSPTMTESDRYRGSSRVKDLVEPGWIKYGSLARLYGIKDITASTSSADITSLPENRTAGEQPFAAMDGDRRTYWSSGGWYGAKDEWLRVQFQRPLRLDKINVAFKQSPLYGPPVSEVTVETEQGKAVRQPVKATGEPQELDTPAGPSDWLRIRVTKLAWEPKRKLGTRVAISELSVPGVVTGRAIVTSALRNTPSGTGTPTIALTGQTGSAAPCMLGSRSWACAQQLDTKGEDGNSFDRVFTLPGSEPKIISGTAVLTDPKSIEAYTTFGKAKLTASSSIAEHPVALGRSAFDGDRATSWVADPLERQPTLNFEFGKRVKLSQLKFVFPYETRPPPATQVALAAEKPGDLRTGWIGQDGILRFAPVETSRLVVKFLQGDSPVQVTEMEIPGVAPYQAPRNLPLKTQCGTGPTFLVEGGFPVATRLISGTLGDLLDGRPVPYVSCGNKSGGQDLGEKVLLPPGTRRILVQPTDPYRIAGAIVRPAGARPAPKATVEPMEVLRWDAETRSVDVRTNRESYLVVNDNFNPGWNARFDGKQLRAVRLDGWRQAWILPANTEGTVEMRYQPDLTYRMGLLGGFLLIMLLIVLAVLPARQSSRAAAAAALHSLRLHPRWSWPIALALGFWIGGLFGLIGVTGMLIILVLMGIALARGASGPVARVARGVSSAVLPGVLVTLAATAAAVGTYLASQEDYALAEPLRDTVPQLICLPLFGFLLWALREQLPMTAVRTADPGTEPEAPGAGEGPVVGEGPDGGVLAGDGTPADGGAPDDGRPRAAGEEPETGGWGSGAQPGSGPGASADHDRDASAGSEPVTVTDMKPVPPVVDRDTPAGSQRNTPAGRAVDTSADRDRDASAGSEPVTVTDMKSVPPPVERKPSTGRKPSSTEGKPVERKNPLPGREPSSTEGKPVERKNPLPRRQPGGSGFDPGSSRRPPRSGPMPGAWSGGRSGQARVPEESDGPVPGSGPSGGTRRPSGGTRPSGPPDPTSPDYRDWWEPPPN